MTSPTPEQAEQIARATAIADASDVHQAERAAADREQAALDVAVGQIAECTVGPDDDIVDFVHNLGGPVLITAYDDDGGTVGYLAAIEITEDESSVLVVRGTAAKLTAVPAPVEA